jgi:RNA polymerase sigma-70 factor (ECF subfamily)
VGAEETTAAIERYLLDLAEPGAVSAAEPVVRGLLERAVGRLHLLGATMLYRNYPRLARPPLNLHADEMLSAVMERLLRALRDVRPATVRQFFGLATQHMRWELNDLARRLDAQSRAGELHEELVPALPPSSSGLSPNAQRMLGAIEQLPQEEREVFDLVRIQGMAHGEAAEIIGVSTKTVQRRLRRSLLLLTDTLADLRPSEAAPG